MITIEPPSTLSIPAPPTNLKRTLPCVSIVLLFAAFPVTVTPQTSASSWQLTWSDEFNDPSGSPPDPAKWNIVTGGKGFGNNEREPYTARPATPKFSNETATSSSPPKKKISTAPTAFRVTTPRLASTPEITSRKNTDASRLESSSRSAKASGPPSGSSARITKPLTGQTAARSTSLKLSGHRAACTAPSTVRATAAAKVPQPNTFSPPASKSTTPSISTPSSGRLTTPGSSS